MLTNDLVSGGKSVKRSGKTNGLIFPGGLGDAERGLMWLLLWLAWVLRVQTGGNAPTSWAELGSVQAEIVSLGLV